MVDCDWEIVNGVLVWGWVYALVSQDCSPVLSLNLLLWPPNRVARVRHANRES